MILLDTTVVSEPPRPAPNPRVLVWIYAPAIDTLTLSAVTVAEIRYGIAAMLESRRRDTLHQRPAREVVNQSQAKG